MLKVWGRKSSSNVQALLWGMEEMSLDYERVDAGFTFGVVHTDAYQQLNPNGKVPTLQDGSNPPLYETGAILRYLANQYASESFWPDDPIKRATVDMWAEWSKINVAMEFTGPLFWQLVRVEESRRDKPGIANATQLMEKNLRIAEAQLAKHAFLAGNDLTLADIQFGHVLYRYFDIDMDRAPLAHLQRYYVALTQRPAFQSAVMLPYEELRNTL